MCSCGCNTCDTKKSTLMLNESLAPRDILSEGLKHHMDNKKPLTEHVYRAGSKNYFNLWAEARSLYSREILEITHEDDLAILNETDLGHFGMFEGKKVPLDFPILNEEVDSYYLDNARKKLSNVYKVLGKEKGQTRRGDKYLQINYIPKSSPQTQNPEFVKIFYDNDDDLKGLDLPMLNESEMLDGYEVEYFRTPRKIWASIDITSDDDFIEDEIVIKGGGQTDEEALEDLKINLEKYKNGTYDFIAMESVLNETEFKGKDVSLNKPKRGGSKAYYVYVRDPKTKKIKKVSFGSGGLKAKINNPEARRAFAARHKCSTKKDKTKAGYWSCRLPRYAKLLGLKSNFTGFW